jgi:hypothetical protein
MDAPGRNGYKVVESFLEPLLLSEHLGMSFIEALVCL